MKTKQIILSVLLICGLTISALAQNITVSGKVIDAVNGKALKGASILIKGTKQGTISNSSGEYKIATQVGKQLAFSLSGYTTQEVTVKNTVHNIRLLARIPEQSKVKHLEMQNQDMKILVEECVSVRDCSRKDKEYSENESMTPPSVQSKIEYKKLNTASNIGNVKSVHYEQQNTEEYSSYFENGFLSAKDEALSTFSLDVDAASYSNVRRIINQGQLPTKDAVRVEEMINYFSYDYPKPKGEHPVSVVTETTVCPWNTQHGLVRIGVKAKEIRSDNLPASNFVFLVDVSGSMHGATRLELVKSSLKLLSNNLREKDRVAIVVYAGAAGEVLSSTAGSNKQKIIDVIERLTAGGSTAGGAGIQLAYNIAEKNFIKDGNNRVILCTDGDFNVGVSSTSELERLIESKRKTGVFLTVLGYGMGNYKDNRLQALAEKGNGNHAYIDNIQEANKVLVNEFGSTMYTVAKDVKIQVEFNPAYVNSYRLVGYESRLLNKEDFNNDNKDAGELGSGHTITAIYEIIPVGEENNSGVDKLKYQNEIYEQPMKKPGKYSLEMLTVKLRYKKPTEDRSIRMEVPVTITKLGKGASKDFKFAIAVAMFGQLLKDSEYKGEGTYEKVLDLAREGLNEDTHGYRREFIRLAESVNQLTK